MARITVKLSGSAKGVLKESFSANIVQFDIPGLSAAEIEKAEAVLHVPGEDASKGVLLSITESKSLWIEQFGITAEVDVKD